MPTTHFWRPAAPSVAGMLRVAQEDRLRTSCSDHFLVVVVCAGAFDGWYRGRARAHVAGGLKLKEPGEVHRDVRVHAPFTLQGAGFSPATVARVADAIGRPAHFRAVTLGAGDRATRLAFAMHAALVRPGASVLEQESRVTDTLAALLGEPVDVDQRAPRAVRKARAFLHDALAEKVTLDALAAHAGMDKFHLLRAFRTEVGLPPYAYLTHLRVAKARVLLLEGAHVADAAQAVGFCDESQLHRHFRRIVGIAPGRFARQLRPSAARASAAQWPDERSDAH